MTRSLVDRFLSMIESSSSIEEVRTLVKAFRVALEEEDKLFIAEDSYKQHLRMIINAKGGVTAVAQAIGIHQSSLSRSLRHGVRIQAKTLKKLNTLLQQDESVENFPCGEKR